MAQQIIANGGNPDDASLYALLKKPSKLMLNLSKKQSKIGVGATVVVESKPIEIRSVYVSNLPLDITEEEIKILFEPQGKIRRIKLYLDESGKPKGDALVSFVGSESVVMACAKVTVYII